MFKIGSPLHNGIMVMNRSQIPSARNSTVEAKVRFNSYHLYCDSVFEIKNIQFKINRTTKKCAVNGTIQGRVSSLSLGDSFSLIN